MVIRAVSGSSPICPRPSSSPTCIITLRIRSRRLRLQNGQEVGPASDPNSAAAGRPEPVQRLQDRILQWGHAGSIEQRGTRRIQPHRILTRFRSTSARPSMPSGVSRSSSPSDRRTFWWPPTRATMVITCWCKMDSPTRRPWAGRSTAFRRLQPDPRFLGSPDQQSGHLELQRLDHSVPAGLLARLPGPDQLHLEPRHGRRLQRRLGSCRIRLRPTSTSLINPNIKAELRQFRLRYAPQRDGRFRVGYAVEVQQPRPQRRFGQLVALQQALCAHR
jgi:hypothetical protein